MGPDIDLKNHPSQISLVADSASNAAPRWRGLLWVQTATEVIGKRANQRGRTRDVCGKIRSMHEPQRDPFFEGPKADIREGVDAIDRGETVPADEVWAHFERRIAALPQDASE